MATTTAPPSSRGGPSGLTGWVDRHFKIGQRGSTVRTELVAGLATWLTMSYILFVNPGILGDFGFDEHGDVTSAPVTIARAQNGGGASAVLSTEGATTARVIRPSRRLVR